MPTIALAVLVLSALALACGLGGRVQPRLRRWRLLTWLPPLALLGWLLGGSLLASLSSSRAERAIRSLAGAALPASTAPASGSSAPARELAALASRFEVMRGTLARFVTDVERRTDDSRQAPPEALRAWLVTRREDVRAAEERLLGAAAVDWGSAQRDDDRLPFSAAALGTLHDALLATALERADAGEPGVGTDLDAADRLAGSLRARPETAARVRALELDRRRLAVLRQLAAAGGGWEASLDALGERTRPLGALPGELLDVLRGAPLQFATLRGLLLHARIEADLRGDAPRRFSLAGLFLRLGAAAPSEPDIEALLAERRKPGTLLYRFVLGPLERPYVRLVAADYATALARAAAVAPGHDACASGARLATPQPLAWWSPLRQERLDLPGWVRRREAAFRVELELTRLVLRTRGAGSEGGGLARAEAGSAACPGSRWVHEARPDGTWIRLEPNGFAGAEATGSFRLLRP
jgi:hypothetical protein